MRREDLFNAIGMVEESRLAQCEKYRNPSVVTHREDSRMKNGRYSRRRNIKRIWLIAAIVALMLFLMGSAITALVSMEVGEARINTYNAANNEEETTVVEKVGEKIEFEKTEDVFIELGPYYPQAIPTGYAMTFVSEGAPLQNQTIEYENEAGNHIRFWIYIGDPSSDIEIYNIVNKTDVSINGHSGILYEQAGGGRALVWINEDQGYGFALRTDDTAVDLIAMAESTAEGEPLVPTRSDSTVKAVEELGDWFPEYLPEGFVEQGTMGCPLEEGGGWYSYVRKWFVNKAENAKIYFETETYAIDTESGFTDDARTICSFFIPGYERGVAVYEEIEINGMFGLATENDIAWADPETHIVYHLYSEDVTGEELLKVARSMIKK